MGYYSQVTGAIGIKPTIPHSIVVDLINAGYAPDEKGNYRGDKDAMLQYDVNTSETAEGRLTSYSGWAIVGSSEDSYKVYTLMKDVQAIVNMLGTEIYRFLGYLEIKGEEQGDLWRIYVKDGKAVEVKPTIVWPED